MDATVLQPDSSVAANSVGNGGETDHLAGAVLSTLGRSQRNMYSLSPSQCFWMGLVSFGIWPLWKMGRQFRGYVTFERQQLWHLAEWLRLRRDGEDVKAIDEHLQRIQPNYEAKRVTTLFTLGACIAIWVMLGHRMSLDSLIDTTWAFHRSWANWARVDAIWIVWVGALGLAYFVHGMSVRKHQRMVDRFIDKLNRVLQSEGVATVLPSSARAGDNEFTSGWWWTAGILAWFGALWAIPMSFAGAIQRHYINTTSARLRTEMLERVQAVLKNRRPPVSVPNYTLHTRRCGNDRCRASLRAGSNFCPRCGTSAQKMSEVRVARGP